MSSRAGQNFSSSLQTRWPNSCILHFKHDALYFWLVKRRRGMKKSLSFSILFSNSHSSEWNSSPKLSCISILQFATRGICTSLRASVTGCAAGGGVAVSAATPQLDGRVGLFSAWPYSGFLPLSSEINWWLQIGVNVSVSVYQPCDLSRTYTGSQPVTARNKLQHICKPQREKCLLLQMDRNSWDIKMKYYTVY